MSNGFEKLGEPVNLGRLLGYELTRNQATWSSEHYLVMFNYLIPDGVVDGDHKHLQAFHTNDIKPLCNDPGFMPFEFANVKTKFNAEYVILPRGWVQTDRSWKKINDTLDQYEKYTLQGKLINIDIPFATVDRPLVSILMMASYRDLDKICIKPNVSIQLDSVALFPVADFEAIAKIFDTTKDGGLSPSSSSFTYNLAMQGSMDRALTFEVQHHEPRDNAGSNDHYFDHAKPYSYHNIGSPAFCHVQSYQDFVQSDSCMGEFANCETVERNLPMTSSSIDVSKIDYADENFSSMWEGCWFIARCPQHPASLILVDSHEIAQNNLNANIDWKHHVLDWISPAYDVYYTTQTYPARFQAPLPPPHFQVMHPLRRLEIRDPHLKIRYMNYVDPGSAFIHWGGLDKKHTLKDINEKILTVPGLVPFKVWRPEATDVSFSNLVSETDSLKNFFTTDQHMNELTKIHGFKHGYERCVRFKLLISPDTLVQNQNKICSIPDLDASEKNSPASPWQIKTNHHDFTDGQPYFYRWLDLDKPALESITLRRAAPTSASSTPSNFKAYAMGYDAQGKIACTFRVVV